MLPGVGRFVPPESREGRASNLRVTAPPYRRISQPREVPLNQLLEDVLDPQKRGPALIHLATVLSPVISLLPIPLFLLFFLIRKCRVTERSGSKIYMIFMYESRNILDVRQSLCVRAPFYCINLLKFSKAVLKLKGNMTH